MQQAARLPEIRLLLVALLAYVPVLMPLAVPTMSPTALNLLEPAIAEDKPFGMGPPPRFPQHIPSVR